MAHESESIRPHDTPFAEVGRIVHEGKAFDAYGAVETDGRLFAYHDEKRGTVTSWDGSVSFGRVVSFHDWKQGGFGWAPIRMRSLRVRRPDGSLWSGRYGYDWRSCVRLRPIAA